MLNPIRRPLRAAELSGTRLNKLHREDAKALRFSKVFFAPKPSASFSRGARFNC